jgi:hypothetical protein
MNLSMWLLIGTTEILCIATIVGVVVDDFWRRDLTAWVAVFWAICAAIVVPLSVLSALRTS